jgi:uncharacterized protein (TIGR02284 family)
MGEVQDTLNHLISTCRDSQKLFAEAAEAAHSENLRRRFAGIARQRADFADELAAYVRKMGAEPPTSGPTTHHDVPRDDSSILLECEAAEENALARYEHALAKDLPVPVRPIVDRHRLAVQETLLDLRSVAVAQAF